MPRRKIAILLPSLGGGGAERLSLDLAEEFTRMGNDCAFIVAQKIGPLVAAAEGIAPVLSLDALRMRDVLGALPAAVEQIRPDAIIANIWPLTSVAALTLSRTRLRRNYRLAVAEHNPLSLQYQHWSLPTRLGLTASLAAGNRLADVRIGVSSGVAKDTARLARMPFGKYDVVYNPVRAAPKPSKTDINAIETVWNDGPSRHGRRFLSVGSFKDQKNFPLAIAAFAKMRKPEDRFLILGDGPLRPKMEQLIADLGLQDSVILPGFLPDTGPFYHSADLFVLSSDYEGFGNVLVEALGTGLPVVSTDCPSGPAEILEDGAFGALVPVGDPERLAQAMDQAKLRGAEESGRLIARAEAFAPHCIAERYLKLLFPHSQWLRHAERQHSG